MYAYDDYCEREWERRQAAALAREEIEERLYEEELQRLLDSGMYYDDALAQMDNWEPEDY